MDQHKTAASGRAHRRRLAGALLAFSLIGSVIAAPTAGAGTRQVAAVVRDHLDAGQTLWPGDELRSANGLYRGVLQLDGNFGIYGPGGVSWASMTPGAGARVSLQLDGNLGFFSPTRTLVSNTAGTGSDNRLTLGDDGVLSLATGGGIVLWTTAAGRTANSPDSLAAGQHLWPGQYLRSANGRYRGVLQLDGNFGIVGPSGVTWASMTPGAGARVSVQTDGNLGFFSATRVLASGTAGTGSDNRLVLTDDGSLNLLTNGGVLLWSHGSGRTGNSSDTLVAGQHLWPGQQLRSANGRFRGVLQPDGNFGIVGPSGVTWASMTQGAGARVSVQTDGNLGFFSASRVVDAGTAGTGSDNRLVLQDDGTLALLNNGGLLLWSDRSGRTGNSYDTLAAGQHLWPGQQLRSANGLYRGVLQHDGNFGVSGPSGVIWASMTPGSGARVSVQTDGNLGFFSSSRILASGTGGTGPDNRLILQSDGNLALWSGSGTPLWSSMTGLIRPTPPPPPPRPQIVSVAGVHYIDGVLVVNKSYSLPSWYAPGLQPTTSNAFAAMRSAAASQGLSLFVASGYRSYSSQASLYAGYVAQRGQAAADRVSARPGHSEHQAGLALDINSTANSFANTPEARWLAANAHRFGFIVRYPAGKEHITGYAYEPWHVRYVGIPLAGQLQQSGLTLEEHFGLPSHY